MHLALDGLSILLVLLTNFLGLMAVICSWKEIDRNVGFFHLNLLWNLGGVVGVFLTLDLFLFFFLWEMMLVPMAILIALWGHNALGGKGRIYARDQVLHLHPGQRPDHAGGDPRPGVRQLQGLLAPSASITKCCCRTSWTRRSPGG